jgi:hypothetical protein
MVAKSEEKRHIKKLKERKNKETKISVAARVNYSLTTTLFWY